MTGIGARRAIDLAVRLPAHVWARHSAGTGAKGQRWYDWALVDITDPEVPGDHALLIRRSIRTGELAFYRCHAPTPVPLATLVAVAGRRWTIEESSSPTHLITNYCWSPRLEPAHGPHSACRSHTSPSWSQCRATRVQHLRIVRRESTRPDRCARWTPDATHEVPMRHRKLR
jgi:hypothetical protein